MKGTTGRPLLNGLLDTIRARHLSLVMSDHVELEVDALRVSTARKLSWGKEC